MIDAGVFNRNQNRLFPPDVMRPYLGFVIAWSDDGTRRLAFAKTYEELYAEMDRRGITDYVSDGNLADADPLPEVPRSVAEPIADARR